MDYPQPPNDIPSPIPKLADVTSHDLVGCSGYRGPMVTLEEMEDAIRKGTLERFPGLDREEPLC
jgi:hypothetical protein